MFDIRFYDKNITITPLLCGYDADDGAVPHNFGERCRENTPVYESRVHAYTQCESTGEYNFKTCVTY